MLHERLRPANFGELSCEPWEGYAKRHGLPQGDALTQFYRQVVYDHFEHFNDHFPAFELSDYTFSFVSLTASEAVERIRFFNRDTLDNWGWQYAHFEKLMSEGKHRGYVIFDEMSTRLTFPFPPIIVDTSKLPDNTWRVYGRPLHLIEGTHRHSFLRHMLTRGLIKPDSQHVYVLATPL